VLLSLALLGCSSSVSSLPEPCAEEPPGPGEVRAKRIVCAAELPEGAEAEIGDWLLENSHVRLTVRSATHRLTQLSGTGGTILDAALPGGTDAITELYPLFEQDWPDNANISADDGTILVEATDGSDLTWRYRLEPDGGLLLVDGATGFTLVPAQGAYRTGDVVQAPHTVPLTIGALGGLDDDGGWVHWPNTDRLGIGELAAVVTALHPDSEIWVGQSDGYALQINTADQFSFIAETLPGDFSIPIPATGEIRALRSGYQPSEWTSPTNDMNLIVGDDGFITTLITDENGDPIPAVLEWNGRRYHLPPGPNSTGVGPGDGSGLIDAGPKYSQYTIEMQTISGSVPLEVALEKQVLDAAWVAVDVAAFPDQFERAYTDNLLTELAARSVDYALLTAGNEVAQASASDDLSVVISYQAGSRADADVGSPIAFPWSNNRREPAHGAAPWTQLNAVDLLAVMSKAGRRQVIVDQQWVESAGPAVNWDPLPDWFILRDLADLSSYTALLDQWVPISVLGENTWVDTSSVHRTEIVRSMTEGRTTASTGPRIKFTINGKGPGSNLATQFSDLEETPDIAIEVENPGDVSNVALIGSNGQDLAQWKLGSPPTHYPIDQSAWVLISVWGDDDWAVTSPIWLKRP
jgi:hypothetical protein